MRQLPAGYAVRPATLDPADLEAVLALWIDVDVAAVGFPDSTADDVRDALSDPRVALAADSRLVLAADGRLVAYARVLDSNESDRFEGDLYVHPELATGSEADAVAQFLLAELERRAAEKVGRQGVPYRGDVVLGRHQRVSAGWVAAAGGVCERAALDADGGVPVRNRTPACPACRSANQRRGRV